MKYMLVIQLSEDSMTFDEMVDLENLLEESLASCADVDGHDIGSGEINYFILTDNPEQAFNQAKVIIDKNFSSEYRVAYRDAEGEEYTILWPENLKVFKVI